MSGFIYGSLVLYTERWGVPTSLKFPFDDQAVVDRGNHLYAYESDVERPFDYAIAGTGVDRAKLTNTTRGVTITGLRVGETSDETPTKNMIYRLLTLNSDAKEEEKTLPYLDLVHNRVSKPLTGSFYARFDVASAKSKMIVISKDIPVYMFVAFDDDGTYLIWSNEESLKQRMREHYRGKFYFYPLPPLVNCTFVVQPFYLRTNFTNWRNALADRLLVMNSLEEYLSKKTIKD